LLFQILKGRAYWLCIDLKPIISINKESKYFMFAKVRGKKKALAKIENLVRKAVKQSKINLAFMHGAAHKEAAQLKERLADLPNIQEIFFCQISPVMVVYTRPGLISVALEPQNEPHN